MDYTVYYEKNAAGTLHIERDGLYYALTAECVCAEHTVLRLYKVCGTEITSLGVMIPTDGKLKLARRVTAASFGSMPDSAVLGAPTDGFLPWRGEIAGKQIDCAFLKQEAGKQILAVPYDENAEYPLIEYLSEAEAVTVGATSCLALHLENGVPVKSESEEGPEGTSDIGQFSEFFSEMPL